MSCLGLPQIGFLPVAHLQLAARSVLRGVGAGQADVAKLDAAVQNTSSDVDLFLTCEWPDAIADGVSKEALPQLANADLSGTDCPPVSPLTASPLLYAPALIAVQAACSEEPYHKQTDETQLVN